MISSVILHIQLITSKTAVIKKKCINFNIIEIFSDLTLNRSYLLFWLFEVTYTSSFAKRYLRDAKVLKYIDFHYNKYDGIFL